MADSIRIPPQFRRMPNEVTSRGGDNKMFLTLDVNLKSV